MAAGRTREGGDEAALLLNARIYAVDEAFRVFEAMAVREGRVAAVGSEAELRAAFPGAREIVACGLPVYPGFIDPHSHFLSLGTVRQQAQLFGTRSWEEAVDRLVTYRDSAKGQGPEWVLGRGWDQNGWECRDFPTKELLDRAFPDTPVLAKRVDGHAAVANSRALALAGIEPGTRVQGGELRVRDGELTGLLHDKAIDLVWAVVPRASAASKREALLIAQRECFGFGLTSVSNANTESEDLLAIMQAQESGELEIRIYAMLRPSPENLRRFVSKGPRSDDRLTIRSIKMYADGALGARSSLLLAPYSDDPGNSGLRIDGAEEIERVCSLAARTGYQVNVHCIGDAAVRLTLDAFARHLRPGNDLRWRIEHAQIVDPADMPRFGSLRVIPSVQASHAVSDMRWAAERLGPRIRRAYAYRELLGQNGWLANGSDFPIESADPLAGFRAAVLRTDGDGLPPGGFQPENALDREQALRAMTSWAARANFEEDSRGSLEPGKLADFTILDRDIMSVPDGDLYAARVVATYLGGESVFERPRPWTAGRAV
jgi:predicted amidohydrolase YtcJ